MIHFQNWSRRRALLVALGIVLFGLSLFLSCWDDNQVRLYKVGLESYSLAKSLGEEDSPVKTPADQAKALASACEAFKASAEVYEARKDAPWLVQFVYPHADRHLAALASFQYGKCNAWRDKPIEAVAGLKNYLILNPGGDSDQYPLDTLIVQYDLELVYSHNPDLQQEEGKGKPKKVQAKQQSAGLTNNQAGHAKQTKI